MSNLRQRLEAKERSELENTLDAKGRDTVRPSLVTATTVLGTSTSTRDRANRAASDAAGDEIVRTETRCGLSEAATYNTRVRDRVEIQSAQREIDNPTPAPETAADYYYAIYKRKEAAEKAAEQKRQQAAADAKRLEAQQSADRLKERLLAITYTGMGATPNEIESIDMLVRQNHPARFGDPDIHKMMLMKLRAECGIVGSTPKLGTIV
jgi:transketolase